MSESILHGLHKVVGSTQQTLISQSNEEKYRCLSPIKQKVFSSDTVAIILEVIIERYGLHRILMIHKEFSGIMANGELYGSLGSRLNSNSLVIVKFPDDVRIPGFIQLYLC